MQSSGNLESRNSKDLDNDLQGYSHIVDLRHCYLFVKWAGGKSHILSKLDSMVPLLRYFEPFVGVGALFFHLVSNRNLRFAAYVSDMNKELITAYKVVKDNVIELIELLKKHQREYKKNPSEYYYKLRDKIKPSDDIEIAARFIALNKTCYNGLYRVNKKGIFNVPIGRYKNPLICDTSNLENASNTLRYSKAVIQIGDYRDVVLKQSSTILSI